MTDETKEIMQYMQEMFSSLKTDINDLQKETTSHFAKIETTLENETNKNIQLLVESYSPMVEKLQKLDTLSDDVETIKMDIDVVKQVVTSHSVALNRLPKAE